MGSNFSASQALARKGGGQVPSYGLGASVGVALLLDHSSVSNSFPWEGEAPRSSDQNSGW